MLSIGHPSDCADGRKGHEMQRIFFPLIFLGFGVLGALFPFHTWSPDGHASAPTAVSMLHAGVLMKLGGYGCFRVAMYLMPEGAAMWGDVFLILTTISVVYGAFSAVVQTDLKYINAYSSVSHCGLVLFALLMMTRTKATRRIVLIDNYVDDRILKVLTKRGEGVSAIIYTDPHHSQITNDLRRHNAQYPKIDVRHCTNVHDRFMIIDDTVYFIGGSIKDLGKKIVAFSQMHQNPNDILSKLR